MHDEFFQAGMMVSRMLMKRDRRISNEVIMCNSRDLYLTCESLVSLNDEVHRYIFQYAKKDHKHLALNTHKTFVIAIAYNNDNMSFGIDTKGNTCSLDIINRCIDWLRNAYTSELDKIKRGVYFNGPENIKG